MFEEPPLLEGYHFASYRPGDEKDWILVEYGARELISEAEGWECWKNYYGGREEHLSGRMFFIENDQGERAATATAYEEKDKTAWLHWVAVSEKFQGQGLSRPLITKALNCLAALGHREIFIPTQTTTWLAVKLYLDLGFLPWKEKVKEQQEGWQIIKTLTGHPALQEFASLEEEKLWDSELILIDREMKRQKSFSEAMRYRVDQENHKIHYQDGSTGGTLSYEIQDQKVILL